jgi:hypothetical protein
MKIIDKQVGHLRDAIAAADAICDLLFDQAEENGTVYSTNRGLRWAPQGGDGGGGRASEDLHATHRLALEQAGGALPPAS